VIENLWGLKVEGKF